MGEKNQIIKQTPSKLFNTKFSPPPIPQDFVVRPQLLKQLGGCRHPMLTLVSAPAGYGKSTLFSYWVNKCLCQSAWLSLDPNDNDLITFLEHFLAAVQTLYQDACPSTKALLSSAEEVPVEVFAVELVNELAVIDDTFTLVLDDYGYISLTEIHDLMTLLLTHMPPNFHLVILTRHDPPFSRHLLRIHSEIVEIRLADLKFRAREIITFLNKSTRTHIDEHLIPQLEVLTEGWPAGLRMIAATLRSRDDVNGIIREMRGSSRSIQDYLVSEVLSRQWPEVRGALLKTSILRRFNWSLCEALCYPDLDGRGFINRLQEKNLFCAPLDNENKWFRYHHLFQDILRRTLGKRHTQDEIAAFHLDACLWFEKNDMLDEALHHAIQSGDFTKAGHLVAHHRHDLINKECWYKLASTIRQIPFDIIKEHPEMLITKAWAYERRGKYRKIADILDRIDNLLHSSQSDSAANSTIYGEIQALRSLLYYGEFNGELAVSAAEEALENLSPQYSGAWGFAVLTRALALQMCGDPDRALMAIHEALQEVHLTPSSEALLFSSLCFYEWIAGDLPSLQQTASQYLRHGLKHKLPETIAMGRYFLGITYYLQNELSTAEGYLLKVIKKPIIMNVAFFTHSAFALSLTYLAQGRLHEAINTVESVIAFTLEARNTQFLELSKAVEAELKIRQGRIAEAVVWTKHFNPDSPPQPFRFYVPHLTFAKILMAKDTTESRQQAANLLSRLSSLFSSTNSSRILIETMALQAMLHKAQGNESTTLKKLTEVVALAEPTGCIRTFLDLGPQMAYLLSDLAKQNIAVGYIGKILAAFRNENPATMNGGVNRPTVSQSSSGTRSENSSLTNRELEILQLLAQRLRNKEIGGQLFISPETVKRHTINIYQKLYVNSRQQAVVKARALGILTS